MASVLSTKKNLGIQKIAKLSQKIEENTQVHHRTANSGKWRPQRGVDNEFVLVWACVVASWFVFQLPLVDVHVLVVTAKGPYYWAKLDQTSLTCTFETLSATHGVCLHIQMVSAPHCSLQSSMFAWTGSYIASSMICNKTDKILSNLKVATVSLC